MSGSANVRSVAAITATKTAVSSFADQVEQALAMIEAESRRLLDWLQHDRPRHWRNQIRLANDDVAEARAALQRCLMYPINDERPSCYEERAALKAAQARLAYCEEKAERLKHWKREIEHEMFQYEGRISQLVRLVEIDMPQAVEMLKRLMERLEEYRAVRVAGRGTSYDAESLAAQLWPEQPAAEDEKTSVEESADDGGRLVPHSGPLPEGEGDTDEGAQP
jgi:exonuclease VII large subunit